MDVAKDAAKLGARINELAVYWLIVNLSIYYERNLR